MWDGRNRAQLYKLLIAVAMDLTDNITSSPKLTRLRVPRQLCGASVGSTFSQGKVSRMSSIRGTIRKTYQDSPVLHNSNPEGNRTGVVLTGF